MDEGAPRALSQINWGAAGALHPAQLAALQGAAGNRATQALLARTGSGIQTAMPVLVQEKMESALGADSSGVRMNTPPELAATQEVLVCTEDGEIYIEGAAPPASEEYAPLGAKLEHARSGLIEKVRVPTDLRPTSEGVGAESVTQGIQHPYWGVFKERVAAMFEQIGHPGEDIETVAQRLWSGALASMASSQSGMREADIYKGRNVEDGIIDMIAPRFKEIMRGFDVVMNDLRGYASSSFAKARSFGFWSKPAGKELAEESCDLTLETSGIGALFDKLPSLDKPQGWDPQLWAALSRTYASTVGQELGRGGKMAHVCLGPEATPGNIFDTIERAAIKRQILPLGEKLIDVVKFHAAATRDDDKSRCNFAVHEGDFKGTAWSGDDLETAREKATNYYKQQVEVPTVPVSGAAAAP